MPLFQINEKNVKQIKFKSFKNEKELQALIENNLEEIFGIRLIASEFPTTNKGRIDTLGLDENNSPVVIEFKESENESIINQGSSYILWIMNHRGDFEKLVEKKIGRIDVDWENPRLILIAKSYNKYDLPASKLLRVSVELKKYRRYENNILLIEDEESPETEIFIRKKKVSKTKGESEIGDANIEKMSKVWKLYSIEYHLNNKDENIKKILDILRDEIKKLDNDIDERIRKDWISYSINERFAILDIKKDTIKINIHDVENIDDPRHWLTNETQKIPGRVWEKTFRVSSPSEIPYAISLIKQSYESTL